MKINTMNDKKIELYLSEEEIESIFGSYELIDYNTPECRVKIHSLLISAAPDTLFPLDCQRVLIEVKPKEYGCTITLTKIYAAIKKYRQIKKQKTLVFIFENSENLINALKALNELKAEKSELYTYKNRYAVIAEIYHQCKNEITHLFEYGTIKNREADATHIREYWQPICTNDAIGKLKDAF